eukprot:m.227476 g.227476  ORF g.227476 m.227476 type:complete len:264 (-) comp33522_c1_seq1:25-816(-)
MVQYRNTLLFFKQCLVMLASAFLLITSCSSAKSSLDVLQHPIVFIHYHKSGHDITRRLSKELTAHFGAKFPLHYRGFFRRQHDEDGCMLESPMWLLEHAADGSDQKYRRSVTKETDFILTAPDFFCNKVEVMFPPSAQIVHFVRNPIELVISGFLYHSQSPTPEPWVKNTRESESNPCKHNVHSLKLMAEELHLDMKLLFNVIELCETLYKSAGADHYYGALLTLAPEQGVRLEACRAMISGGPIAGGDLLRMTNNAHRLQTW